MRQRTSVLALWVSLFGPACSSGEPGDGHASAEPVGATVPVHLLDYVADVPESWGSNPPGSSMRLAEFTVPLSAGSSEPAEVVVYFFGAGQGGDAAANAERWQAQFFDESGNHPEPEVRGLTDAAFPTTVVMLRGAYARTIGMGGTAADAKPDQVLLAAVVETPSGNLFVQAHGPAAEVLAARDAYLALVRGIRPAS